MNGDIVEKVFESLDDSFRGRFNELKNSEEEIMQEIYNEYPAVQALAYNYAVEDFSRSLEFTTRAYELSKQANKKRLKELEKSKRDKDRYKKNIAAKKQRNGKEKSYQDLFDEINAEHPFLEKEIVELNLKLEEKGLEFEIEKEESNKLIDIYVQERDYIFDGDKYTSRLDMGESIDNKVYKVLEDEFGIKPQGSSRKKTTTQRMREVEKKKPFRIPLYVKITGLAALILTAGFFAFRECISFDTKPRSKAGKSMKMPDIYLSREKPKSEIEKIIEKYDRPLINIKSEFARVKLQHETSDFLTSSRIRIDSYNPKTKELKLLAPSAGFKKLKPIKKNPMIGPEVWREFYNKDVYLLPGKLSKSDLLLYYDPIAHKLYRLRFVKEYFLKGELHPKLKKDFDDVKILFGKNEITEDKLEKGFYVHKELNTSDYLKALVRDQLISYHLFLTKNRKTQSKKYFVTH